MGSKGLGPLLPRDFLERQPKRWQKSQRKRGAVRALTKLASQRKKLEERAISDQRRDAARRAGDDTLPEKPHRERQLQRAEAKRREASAVTAIGATPRGAWAAQLVPGKPVVVALPAGTQLSILQAALAVDDGAPGMTVLRCRVPASQLVTTLCQLEAGAQECCRLHATFGEADERVALAAEGASTLHVVGCYARTEEALIGGGGGVDAAMAAAVAAAARAATAQPPATTATSARPPAPTPASAPAPAAAAPTARAPGSEARGGRSLEDLGEGLKAVDFKVGRGRPARSGDLLTVKYSGQTNDADGEFFMFDDNRGRPMQFTLGAGEVVRGWDRGMVGMRVGGIRRLVVPPMLGYGARGAGVIPPNAMLVFECEVVNVQAVNANK